MSTYEANRYNFSGANVTGIPTSAISSGTFADARLSSSSVTQHVDLSNLNASNLTSGSIPNARVASGAVTQHVTPTTQTTGSWTPTAGGSVTNGFNNAVGRYLKIGKLVYVVGRWEIPHGTFGSNQASQGLGYNSTSQFKLTGLPFTSANTSQPVMSVGAGHCTIHRGKTSTYFRVVLYHNTSELRFFGNEVPYNSSYSFDGNYDGPNTGYESAIGNFHLTHTEGDKKYGSCSFVYYTD